MKTMRALELCKSGGGSQTCLLSKDHPVPVPRCGEVLVKVIYAGVCGTDLEILHGYKSRNAANVLGHEFVGRICGFGPHSKRPEDTHLNEGARVVAEINCVPYDSKHSRNAYERAQDSSRTAIGIFGKDGVFAEYVTVPSENIHIVPDSISDLSAVFVEPVAAACQILEQISIPGSAKVGVLGAGKLGWIVAGVLTSCGKDVTVITRTLRERTSWDGSPLHDRILAEKYGASILQLSNGISDGGVENRFDVVIDCSGNPAGLKTALWIVKPRGIVVLKSTTATSPEQPSIDLTPVVVKEIQVVGSRCGPFDVALRLLASKKLSVEDLIQEILPGEDAEEGLRRAAERGCLKVILHFDVDYSESDS